MCSVLSGLQVAAERCLSKQDAGLALGGALDSAYTGTPRDSVVVVFAHGFRCAVVREACLGCE